MLDDKNLEKKIEGKRKKFAWVGSVEEREPKSFLKSFEIIKNMWKAYVFKKLSERFSIGQKIGSINQKSHSINPASIEERSSKADSNQIFNRNFNRSSYKFDQSKIWKNQIFEKQSILMQKLLKEQCFMNKMHEYEMKRFSKTLEFNPDLPKTRFSINLSSNLKH